VPSLCADSAFFSESGDASDDPGSNGAGSTPPTAILRKPGEHGKDPPTSVGAYHRTPTVRR